MPVNYLTFGELDSKSLQLLRLTEKSIHAKVRQGIINDLIYKRYGMMDGVDSPFWNTILTLTIGTDQEILKDSVTNGGVITAIDSTAKSISRNSGTFAVGALVFISIITKATSVVAAEWVAKITVGGAAATYAKVGTGTEATFNSATQMCTVLALKKFSATSADISDQYVKKIVKVFDDQGESGTERVFDLYEDSRAYGDAHRNPYKTGRIACYHAGNTIYFSVGLSAPALGVVQTEAVSKPNLYTDASIDTPVNFPPEWNALLTDEVVEQFAKHTGVPVPADVAGRLAEYRQALESNANDKLQSAK